MTGEKIFPTELGGDRAPRTYKNGVTYTPVPLAERKIGVNKPDDPRAVRFHGRWFLPLDVLPDEKRSWPETIPDDVAYEHMSRRTPCRCVVCRRPSAEAFKRKWRREHGLRPVRDRRPRA